MYKIAANDFDLRMIMDSGQVFRIREIEENMFFVAAGNHGVKVRQVSETDGQSAARPDFHVNASPASFSTTLHFSCTEEEFREFWYSYFDLDTDYGKLKETVDPSDAYLTAAIQYGGGIRVLRQDLWEMIISFLISQNNNITRIRKSIETLCERFGQKYVLSEDDFIPFHAFPTPEAICAGGLEGLQGLGLGYRDKYILKMAERCCGEAGAVWLETLRKSDYETAVTLLLQEFGIGRKVADCICLFSLHHVDAFPIDTHIRQILERYYPQGFPFERYQGYAGILQQYMFAYKLTLPKTSKSIKIPC